MQLKNPVPPSHWPHSKGSMAPGGWWSPHWTAQRTSLSPQEVLSLRVDLALLFHCPTRVTSEASAGAFLHTPASAGIRGRDRLSGFTSHGDECQAVQNPARAEDWEGSRLVWTRAGCDSISDCSSAFRSMEIRPSLSF